MKVIGQRGSGDCGIASLATLTGTAYEDVYHAMATLDANRGKRGVRNRDVIAAAHKLGISLKARRRFDLDEDAGILTVQFPKGLPYGGHFVVLYAGMIVDPDGPQILPHEEWFRVNAGRPATLLVEA